MGNLMQKGYKTMVLEMILQKSIEKINLVALVYVSTSIYRMVISL